MCAKRVVIYSPEQPIHASSLREIQEAVHEAGCILVWGSILQTVNPRLVSIADLVMFHGAFAGLEFEYKKILQRARSEKKQLVYAVGEKWPEEMLSSGGISKLELSRVKRAVMKALLDVDAVLIEQESQAEQVHPFNDHVSFYMDFLKDKCSQFVREGSRNKSQLWGNMEKLRLLLRHYLAPAGSYQERLWLMPGRARFVLISEGWEGVWRKILAKIPGVQLHSKPPFEKVPVPFPTYALALDLPSALVSIVILSYNNLNYTRLCLESIYEKTQYPNFEVILVDNASEDGSKDFFMDFSEAHDNFRLILNDQNLGFARGNNQGVELAMGDVIVFLNNDTVVTHGWLEGLMKPLQYEKIGLVGPVTNSSPNASQVDVDYGSLEEMEDFARRFTKAHSGSLYDIPMLIFFCVAIRRDVINAVGPLDEQFGIGMFEDDDYAVRVKQAGYRVVCTEEVFVHHWGSATLSHLTDHSYWRLQKENRLRYEKKWGVKWKSPMLPY